MAIKRSNLRSLALQRTRRYIRGIHGGFPPARNKGEAARQFGHVIDAHVRRERWLHQREFGRARRVRGGRSRALARIAVVKPPARARLALLGGGAALAALAGYGAYRAYRNRSAAERVKAGTGAGTAG